MVAQGGQNPPLPSAACLSVPLLMLCHPIYNLRFRIQGLRHRRDNYTWATSSNDPATLRRSAVSL